MTTTTIIYYTRTTVFSDYVIYFLLGIIATRWTGEFFFSCSTFNLARRGKSTETDAARVSVLFAIRRPAMALCAHAAAARISCMSISRAGLCEFPCADFFFVLTTVAESRAVRTSPLADRCPFG